MNAPPVLLTRGSVCIRGYRRGRYGGVFVDDERGIMGLSFEGFGPSQIWAASPGGRPRFAELSDDDWTRLGWTISPISEDEQHGRRE
ncbi:MULTISPECIES: hypothetical protein [Mycolicibacter]|uniref:Uncharacterized protein n=2 Tax=Mycolicibacter TaxID=1073531 RepID=A0ABU5XMB0_9MYCO|nr:MULTISPECIES: hypothetical protein [unclassified Mycolicibacter]MEB3023415.1 hypothetical protein [Mycolicibacter sp. MYC098]MEB3033757.1 hypothetical protein [Mycolicibacter sp. MYC340]